MRTSNTIYSGQTTLGNETFGKLNPSTPAGCYTNKKRTQYSYCNPSRCVKVQNYQDLYTLRAAVDLKYHNNQNIIKAQKNNLVSGLYTELDLNGVKVISNSTTNVSPTTINFVSLPYIDYNIDPSGELFGNTICGLNNFINYKALHKMYSY